MLVSVVWFPNWLGVGFGLLVLFAFAFGGVTGFFANFRKAYGDNVPVNPATESIESREYIGEERKQIANAARALLESLEPFRTTTPDAQGRDQLRKNYDRWLLLISPKLGDEQCKTVQAIGDGKLGMKNLRKGEELMRIRSIIIEYTTAVTRE